MTPLLPRLLARGDAVFIDRGILRITPASGIPVPDSWLADNRLRLCQEVLRATGKDALEYVGYDTGHYGRSRAGGVTLQFVSVVTGEEAYTIFNADLNRSRNTKGGKAGGALPAGEFRVGKRSAFFKFWQGSGLAVPDRLQRFHKRMGKLRGILFTATRSGNRLNAQSISPLSVPPDHLKAAIMRHNLGTTEAHAGHNLGTTTGHKETQQRQKSQGLQPFSTTCVSNHGNTVIREEGYTDLPPSLHTEIEDPSIEEWLSDYDAAPSISETPITQAEALAIARSKWPNAEIQ